MRAGLTPLSEIVRRMNLLHWPGLTPADEAGKLTLCLGEIPGNRQSTVMVNFYYHHKRI